MDNLINSKEAAELLGVSEEKLSKLVELKLVPAYIIAEKFLRFKKEELEALKGLVSEKLNEERIFDKGYSKIKGFGRFKEILAANDIYIFLLIAILLIVGFMLFFR